MHNNINHRTTSIAGIELIKYFEGFKTCAYKCPGKYSTIGYGHKILNKENFGACVISMNEAEDLLKRDLIISEKAVLKYINASLTDNQFDALVSFTFNLGAGALQRSSLRQKINYGSLAQAAEEFPRWVYANGIRLNGLVKRRNMEKELFLS